MPRPKPWIVALGLICLLGLLLRLWGIKYGLPFGYQMDEERLYVPQAAAMLDAATFDPGYFQNPPLYTYLLRELFSIRFGGDEISQLLAVTPGRGDLFITARVATALIGTAAIGLIYLFATRLFSDRRAGLLAAGLMAVAFLPVFYSHVALNNIPAMAGTCLALVGVAELIRTGRTRSLVIAGLGIGLAAATKYINGFVLIPLLITIWTAPGWDRRARARGTALAFGLVAVTFAILNPYALIHPSEFLDELKAQENAVEQIKVGMDPDEGIPYYLSVFAWGLGVIPALAAIGGAILLFRRERRLFWIFVPVIPAFILFMGTNSQYFGRWMLPLFPLACVLAAYAGIRLIDALDGSRLGSAAMVVVPLALVAQSLVYVVHNDRVLSRPHTFNVARDWMLENIPRNARIVIEPKHHDYWDTPWPRADQALFDPEGREIIPKLYAPHLVRRLVGQYEQKGFCWVQVSSDYWGPALIDNEGRSEGAAGYYETLAKRGRLVFSASPYGDIDDAITPGEDEVAYSQDWAYNFYPLAYSRPGPGVLIYRLRYGRCAPAAHAG